MASSRAGARTGGIRIDVELTTRPREGEAIAHAAALDGRRRILVAGGDGSVHDVVNGIMNAGLDENDRVTLAVAPGGTGNDWARSLGIGRDPQAVVAAFVGGRTRLLDVGVIDFPDAQPPTRRWFVNVAGAGYDAHVIARLPERIPSSLAYFKGALSGLSSYRSPMFHVAADGESVDGRLLSRWSQTAGIAATAWTLRRTRGSTTACSTSSWSTT